VAVSIQVYEKSLAPATPEALEWLDQVHHEILKYEQCPVHTRHLIHGGMYARTIVLEPETAMVGSIILKPTILIIYGRCSVLSGDERIELSGYTELHGHSGRKQFFWTHSEVYMTMLVRTDAKTVEEAENEVFGEADQLISRREGSDSIIITAEE
jgi:hypothetical protein